MAVATFRGPDIEEARLFMDVRDKWHPHLDGYLVQLVFRDKPRIVGGRQAAAVAMTAPAVWTYLSDIQGIVEVYEGTWERGEDWQRYLLDHELCHFEPTKWGTLAMVSHDIQDFREVLARHDPGVTGLRSMVERRVEGDGDGDE